MSASPEAKSKARALLTEGSTLYQSGDIAGALEKFKQAHATYASPKIHFNLGQAYRDLGRFDDSMAAFEKFLIGASDASPEALADARRAVAELKPKLGRVRIECPIPGAEVSIDGRVEGQAPLPEPVWAMPGRHQIIALAAGSSPLVEKIDVVAGAEVLVDLNPRVMQATGSNDRIAPSRSAPQRVNEPGYDGQVEQAAKRSEQSDGWWLGQKWTWVAAGSTVVLAGAASITGVWMQSKFDTLRRSCGRASLARAGCSQSDIDSVVSLKDTANVLWGLTAAAAVATGALFYFEDHPVTVAPLAGGTTGLIALVRY
jgi:hypothetical protein